MISAIGELAALHQLGLISSINYISGISGGGWGVSVYSYSQARVSDTVLLGPILEPSCLTYENLNQMDANCARRLTNKNFKVALAEAAAQGFNGLMYGWWKTMVSNNYLIPSGIPEKAYFSWNEKTATVLKTKVLPGSTIILPRSSLGIQGVDKRPFPILGISLVGPYAEVPFSPSGTNSSFMESSPVATGFLNTGKILSFTDSTGARTENIKVTGMIETFAAGTCCPPSSTIQSTKNTFVLGFDSKCLCADQIYDLKTVAGTGSYALGMEATKLQDPVSQYVNIGRKQFSLPLYQSGVSQKEYAVSDGGNIVNDNFISFLQRKITKIIVFVNTVNPLAPASQWNPYGNIPYSPNVIDTNTASYFGVFASGGLSPSNFLIHNQVFPSSDFSKVVAALQAAQAVGNGIVATLQHTTVANSFFGIKQGLKVKVTWVYLGRATAWESQLKPELQAMVVPPPGSPLNVNIKNGTFANFPNYATQPLDINYRQANLLADFTGWVVLQNANLFRNALK